MPKRVVNDLNAEMAEMRAQQRQPVDTAADPRVVLEHAENQEAAQRASQQAQGGGQFIRPEPIRARESLRQKIKAASNRRR